MAHIVAGLFKDSKHAGMAVAELRDQGFTKDISVVAKDEDTADISSHEIQTDVTQGAKGGAAGGALAGGILGVLAGATSVIIPGVGPLLALGPLAALWGLTGAAAGALTGGLIGGFVDAGFSKNQAEEYEGAIRRGEVLVAVTAPHEREENVTRILRKHRVYAVDMAHGE